MFYIFHGEEEFARSKELDGLHARLAEGDPAMAQLNTTILDGRHLSMGELRHACDTIPFMHDRRLVIVHGLLGWLVQTRQGKGKGAQEDQQPASRRTFLKALKAYLPALPETTRLVFMEEQALKPSHPILKLAREAGMKDRAHVKEFKQPKEWDLPSWIQQLIRNKGGDITWDASKRVVELAGNDMRQLDQEAEKLLLYAEGRQITKDNVDELTSRVRAANIFKLVDCVGRREADEALRELHNLLDENEPPLRLLGMLARQIRLLIQIKEFRAERMSETMIAKRLKLHHRVVPKMIVQAGNFSMTQLEKAHALLVDTDWTIKTGDMEDKLALDLLVVSLTRL